MTGIRTCDTQSQPKISKYDLSLKLLNILNRQTECPVDILRCLWIKLCTEGKYETKEWMFRVRTLSKN